VHSNTRVSRAPARHGQDIFFSRGALLGVPKDVLEQHPEAVRETVDVRYAQLFQPFEPVVRD
jgi:hypothetical protein